MDKLKLTFRVQINNLNIIKQNILIFVQRYRSKIRTRDSGAGYLLPFSLRHFAYHGHGPNLLFTQGYDAMVLYYSNSISIKSTLSTTLLTLATNTIIPCIHFEIFVHEINGYPLY